MPVSDPVESVPFPSLESHRPSAVATATFAMG